MGTLRIQFSFALTAHFSLIFSPSLLGVHVVVLASSIGWPLTTAFCHPPSCGLQTKSVSSAFLKLCCIPRNLNRGRRRRTDYYYKGMHGKHSGSKYNSSSHHEGCQTRYRHLLAASSLSASTTCVWCNLWTLMSPADVIHPRHPLPKELLHDTLVFGLNHRFLPSLRNSFLGVAAAWI